MPTPVLKYTFKIEHLNQGLDLSIKQKTISVGQTAQGGLKVTLSIAITETPIDLSELGSPGVIVIRNLDSMHFVTVGPDTGGGMEGCMEVRPGEEWPFRLAAGAMLIAKANTAPCKILVSAYED